ncbi:hypothetical protein GCM10010399_28380 [Dactylosporangium fulvum]
MPAISRALTTSITIADNTWDMAVLLGGWDDVRAEPYERHVNNQ